MNHKDFFDSFGEFEVKYTKLVGFMKHFENDITIEELYQMFAQRMAAEAAERTRSVSVGQGEAAGH